MRSLYIRRLSNRFVDSIPGDGDGISVAIDGDTVVIGAWTRNYTQPEEAGVVFVGRIP